MISKRFVEQLPVLKSWLSYNEYTGEFTWLKSNNRRIKIGSRAGSLCGEYRRIMINRVSYLEHQLAWYFMKGVWPSLDIDHRNTIKIDNRWENLREVSKCINQQNILKATKASTTGYLGVIYDKRRRKYIAQLGIKGKTIYLGAYETAQEASIAYLDAKNIYHIGHKEGIQNAIT